MKNILYLASKSKSRKSLLERAGIEYKILEQDADESQCDWEMQLQKVVESIAEHKMKQVIMPDGKDGQIAFVLTADTLSIDPTGAIRGKPDNLQHAIEMIKLARDGMNRCGTALCLEKKEFKNNIWQTVQKQTAYAEATYQFIVPDELIVDYIQNANALVVAGAIKIEDGPQFLKFVNGSYTAIIGLPMYELWQALTAIGFF